MRANPLKQYVMRENQRQVYTKKGMYIGGIYTRILHNTVPNVGMPTYIRIYLHTYIHTGRVTVLSQVYAYLGRCIAITVSLYLHR